MRSTKRHLIVNADDFGLTEGVNRGIIEAHQQGIVTSASLMVRAPAAADAATLALANPGLGLGLHIDMGEWVLRSGRWIALYEYVSEGDAAGAALELDVQMALFGELTGILPDHLDSHQHVHISRPELSDAVAGVADRLGIGVRSRHRRVAYRGLYGQDAAGQAEHSAIAPEAYVAAIRDLLPGVTEFGCHPGYAEGLESDYALERPLEVASLCDPRVRAAVTDSDVRLVTWRDVRGLEIV